MTFGLKILNRSSLWKKHRIILDLKTSIVCHIATTDRKIFSAAVEHAITRLEPVLNANGMYVQHILRLNKVFGLQFEIFGLHAPHSHLVVKI